MEQEKKEVAEKNDETKQDKGVEIKQGEKVLISGEILLGIIRFLRSKSLEEVEEIYYALTNDIEVNNKK